jgi:hypothetical protein
LLGEIHSGRRFRFYESYGSGCRWAGYLSCAAGEPVCGREAGGFAGLHGGQAGEDVLEVFAGVDAEPDNRTSSFEMGWHANAIGWRSGYYPRTPKALRKTAKIKRKSAIAPRKNHLL